MKKSYLLIVVVIFLFTTSLISAKGNPSPKSILAEKYETIEANYLIGLNSDNDGLQQSSAYFLGEIKSEKAIIPFMKILRSSEKEYMRIYAALALVKIGDPRAVYYSKKNGNIG